MVQLLILYFLSIKATHGYEIQRFISLNQMNGLNTIKSGSIYYAINKLEKDGCIHPFQKEKFGEKKKQIYEITQKGKDMLKMLAHHELSMPLQGILSEQFVMYPIAVNLSKPELVQCIKKHMDELDIKKTRLYRHRQNRKEYIHQMESATLKYMQDSIDNQINWYNQLLDNLDETITEALQITEQIRKTDYTKFKETCI